MFIFPISLILFGCGNTDDEVTYISGGSKLSCESFIAQTDNEKKNDLNKLIQSMDETLKDDHSVQIYYRNFFKENIKEEIASSCLQDPTLDITSAAITSLNNSYKLAVNSPFEAPCFLLSRGEINKGIISKIIENEAELYSDKHINSDINAVDYIKSKDFNLGKIKNEVINTCAKKPLVPIKDITNGIFITQAKPWIVTHSLQEIDKRANEFVKHYPAEFNETTLGELTCRDIQDVTIKMDYLWKNLFMSGLSFDKEKIKEIEHKIYAANNKTKELLKNRINALVAGNTFTSTYCDNFNKNNHYEIQPWTLVKREQLFESIFTNCEDYRLFSDQLAYSFKTMVSQNLCHSKK